MRCDAKNIAFYRVSELGDVMRSMHIASRENDPGYPARG